VNHAQIIAACREADIRLVRFLYCDNGSIIRGKLAHRAQLASRLEGGIGLTVAMQAFDMLDRLIPVPGMGPVGEVRLAPDPDTFRVLPYAPRSAALLCDLLTLDRQPWGACPRSFLKRMIARAAARGLVVQAAFENEFSLLRPDGAGGFTPYETGLCFSTVAMTATAELIDEIVAALEQQRIAIDGYYPEYGAGQHELPIRYAPALEAADNQIWLRETVRSVAARHDVLASFAAKPLPDQPGNGCHIHWSLWDRDQRVNLLYAHDGPFHLSPLALHFIAGVLAHLPGLLALTAPTFNSYRRLQPQHWCSAFTAWGPDNREAAVRVASPFWGSEANSLNLEFKASDPTNNPYLALGGLIAAGLDGVERQLDPGEPCLVDPAELSDEERAARGYHRYPTTLAAACDALAADPVLMEALGPELSASYLAVKRAEYAAFAAEDVAYEIREHIAKF
jgi:glutamine synthetase